MTLEQLRIFVAVAEHLNMRAAGEVLHLSQPAVSSAIAALEQRHATRLLDRVGRGLALTSAGESFLPEARAVLDRAEAASRHLRDLAGLSRGRLRIAASQTVATYWLPARMARFAQDYPGIEATLAGGNTRQAVDGVLNGEVDCAVVEGAVDNAHLVVRYVGGDRLGLYAAPDHPLAAGPVSWTALRDLIWVLREEGSGTREHFAAMLATYDLGIDDLDLRLTLPSNGAVLEAVAGSHMVTVVSDLAAASRVAAREVIRLDYPFPPRDFSLITHRSRQPGAGARTFIAGIP